MAEEKKPNFKPSSGSSKPQYSKQQFSKPASSSPWHDLGHDAEEIIFIILVVVLIGGALLGFFRGNAMRSLVAQVFNPVSLSYYDTANGARVFVPVAEANVRESAGGIRIGGQPNGAVGIVVGGPVFVLKRFWDINFDSGSDGWVDEAELQLFKPNTIVSRIASVVVGSLKLLSTFLSLLFLSGIVYSVIRISQVIATQRKKEHSKEGSVPAASAIQEHTNRRWERVIAHVQSENPSDWRLAILESDIMLAELLERMGYAGENVGEKLKTVEQSDFNTIEQAWEAHKVRNLIAHQGSDYLLSSREAQRVISLYANVFREFRYV